jgi:hypothetical protein
MSEKKDVQPGGGFGSVTRKEREEAERKLAKRDEPEIEDKSVRGPKEKPKPY